MDQSKQDEPARIDDLLVAYRELQLQFDRVRDRQRRAEENRHTVQRRIYDRVRGDYDRELDALRARMSPLRDEIDRMQESIEAQSRDATSIVQAVEDELAEAEFRHRIGEFEENAFAALRQSLDARAAEARSRQALLETTMTTIATMRRPEAHDEPVAVNPDAPAAEVTPDAPVAPEEAPAAGEATLTLEDELPRRPVLNARSVSQGHRSDGFENPQNWISEMGPESARADRRAVVSPPVPARSPAAPAADGQDSVKTSTVDYPSLVFVSGPHAGQAIALLPTTVTIGREHDNNIEIKDPDVARYHARILRERDEYIVEDLNSSTGTWVNGERKQRAVLTHGDVIRMGQTELALDFEWTTDSN